MSGAAPPAWGRAVPSAALGDRAAPGFSFLEILVTLIILSLVLTSLVVAFRNAAASWSQAQARSVVYETARGMLDQLARDLEQAVAVAVRPGGEVVALRGTAETCFFLAPVPGHREGTDLCEIGYWRDAARTVKRVLVRDDRRSRPAGPLFDGDFTTPNPEAASEDLADGVTMLEFAYWDGAVWRSTWTGPGVPRAVRVSLEVEEAPGGWSEQFVTSVTVRSGR